MLAKEGIIEEMLAKDGSEGTIDGTIGEALSVSEIDEQGDPGLIMDGVGAAIRGLHNYVLNLEPRLVYSMEERYAVTRLWESPLGIVVACMGETYPVTAALTFVGSIMADSKRALAADPVVAGLARVGLAFAEVDDSIMELDGLKLEACTLHQCNTEEQLIHSC